MTATILQKITETKRREVDEAKRHVPIDELRDAIDRTPEPRDFFAAVAGGGDAQIRLIAEIKKASPSAGLIRPDFDPAGIARSYQDAGAAALSVLTDKVYFQGDLSYLVDVKAAVPLPVLRKDFTIDEYQIYESRAAGADAVLLIAEILSPQQIEVWSRLACDLGMSSLIEVHDAAQLRAVREFAGGPRRAILGINNRDLHVQETNLETTERLASELDSGTPFVSESGIKTRDDVLRLQAAGATAMLIGETLMRSEDPCAKARELLGG